MAEAGIAVTENDWRGADLSSNEPELRYAERTGIERRRSLGQFFTPYTVARFMSQWLTEVGTDRPDILDPCAGLGVFERALREAAPGFAANARFTLWEKDEMLARDLHGICKRIAIDHSVTCRDFLHEHAWSTCYDAIIANPPYNKHHFVENKEVIRDTVSSKLGTVFSVQTNIYCWFLIKALSLLKRGGRLAFIVPTEFLNANYGTAVKKFLLDGGSLRHVIAVCYKSNTFDGALTTACVLLAHNAPQPSGSIRFYRAESADRFGDLTRFLADTEFAEYPRAALDAERKWRSYFPGSLTIDTTSAGLVPFSTYGRFSRGIATGANRFFTLRPSDAAELALPSECLIRCISKAAQARGKVFAQHDFEALEKADKPVYLFDGEASSAEAVGRYIRSGEARGYQDRYLTRMRKPWYALEKRKPSKIWVAVFGRAGIRFIWNESRCISLTCFHVFQPSQAGEAYLPFLFLYLNSTTGRKFLELEKREYGDGLEKYEPNDINKSMAPDFGLLEQQDLSQLAALQSDFIAATQNSPEEEDILAKAEDILAVLASMDDRTGIGS